MSDKAGTVLGILGAMNLQPTVVAALIGLIVLAILDLCRSMLSPYPRGFKHSIRTTSSKNNTSIDEDASYDAICIGSGIANLAAAALLSLCGWRVLVLESHSTAGGATHTFRTKFCEHEVGVHYLGSPPTRLLNLITGGYGGVTKKDSREIRFQRIANESDSVYDEVLIGKRLVRFCAGEENLRKELERHFPSARHRKAIDKYFRLIKDASSHRGFYVCKIIRPTLLREIVKKAYCSFINPSLHRYQTMTTWQTLTEELGDDASPELLNVLCSRFGQVGPSPFADTFASHACVVKHFLNGGYYPVGGSDQFFKKISPTILEAGGSIKVRKHVDKILVDEKRNKVDGVRLKNGKTYRSPVILSGAGIRNTYKYLLADSLSATKFPLEQMEEKIGVSVKFVFCFFDLDGSSEELDLKASNLWELPLSSGGANIQDFLQSFLNKSVDEKDKMPLFISSVSAKDPSYQKRYPGKSAAVVITYSQSEDFKEWDAIVNQRARRKSDSYAFIKERYKIMLTEQLHRHFPKTRGKVLHSEVATPLTTKTFLNAPDGEFRGLDENAAKASFQSYFQPETSIGGLYLCGQELTMLGVFSALQAGVLAASAVLKYGTLFDLLKQRTLVSDLECFRDYKQRLDTKSNKDNMLK